MYRDRIASIIKTSAEADHQVLSYLEEKYKQPFEIIGHIGQSWRGPCEHWGVKPKSGSEGFTVTGSYTPQLHLRDSYYCVLILPEYIKQISSLARDLLPKHRILVELDRHSVNPDGLTAKISVAEIHKHTEKNGPIFQSKITLLFPVLKHLCNRLTARQKSYVVQSQHLSLWQG